ALPGAMTVVPHRTWGLVFVRRLFLYCAYIDIVPRSTGSARGHRRARRQHGRLPALMYLNPNEPLRRLSARPAPTLALILGILVLAAGMYVGRSVMAPSPALPAAADARLFSAERAMPILERLVGDGQPHMVDTQGGEAARRRVVDEFEALGYEVELQNAWGCREQYAACANVTNVLARLLGTGD